MYCYLRGLIDIEVKKQPTKLLVFLTEIFCIQNLATVTSFYLFDCTFTIRIVAVWGFIYL